MNNDEPFLIAIKELDIPIDSIVADCKQITEHYKQANQTQDLQKPYSIVLTQNPGVTELKGDLVGYKDVHNTQYFDRNNQAVLRPEFQSTSLTELVKALPFPFSIMRLSVLPPSTIIAMHTDAACHAQLAITTNDDCFVAARSGESKHIPVDGKLYIISTTLPHTAFNASSEERIHLSISIFDDDYVKLLKSSVVTD